ncbi:MAG: hypothetical protein ACRDZO_14080 [Egibacteraceae bacterium]
MPATSSRYQSRWSCRAVRTAAVIAVLYWSIALSIASAWAAVRCRSLRGSKSRSAIHGLV